MIGNISEFVEKLNNFTQEKYLCSSHNQITVERLAMKRDESIDFKRVIPLTDCIMAEIDAEGELKGFKIRPEMAKVIMWREEGKNLT